METACRGSQRDSMLVQVVQVREVAVLMFQGLVGMLMAVLTFRHGFVRVRVVPIRVVVGVGMRLRRVRVQVNMFLCDGEVGSQQHNRERSQEEWGGRRAENQERERDAEEWSRRIISAGPGRPQLALSADIKEDA